MVMKRKHPKEKDEDPKQKKGNYFLFHATPLIGTFDHNQKLESIFDKGFFKPPENLGWHKT
jgi:hypothetical protein